MIIILFIWIIIRIVIFTLITVLPILVDEKLREGDYQPFECGIESIMLTRIRFSIQFFIIGLIFVVFDLEVVFLLGFIPQTGLINIITTILFSLIMLLGLVYEWKINKLVWVKC